MKHQHIHPDDLVFIQSRAATNEELVAEYADLMADEEFEFDPVEALEDGAGGVFVWDGTHRGEAARRVNRFLLVNLKPGTRAEAEWLALGANQKHGLRRSREDRQYVVRQALQHPEGASRSDREIGRHCGVDHKTVGRIRAELEASGEISRITERTVTRNGVTYQQETAGISAAEADETSPSEAEADMPDWLKDDGSESSLEEEDDEEEEDDDIGGETNRTVERSSRAGGAPASQPTFERDAATLPAQPRQRALKFAQVNQGGIALEVTLYIDGVAHSVPVTTMLAHGPIAGLPEMSLAEDDAGALILPYELAKRLKLVFLDNVTE
ncbi:MAG: hypothetical protein Kow0031_19300 [Anaerolineae bacterium]